MWHISVGTSGGTPALPIGNYGIGMEQLTAMTRDHDFSALQEYGGVTVSWFKDMHLMFFVAWYWFVINYLEYCRSKGCQICWRQI